MKNSVKLIAMLLLAFLGLFPSAQAHADTALAAEKRVVMQWVQKNAHKGVTTAQIRQIVEMTYKHAKARQLDPILLIATMRQESRFKASAKGGSSVGLMQVLPRWHRDKIAGRNIMEPDVNVEVGSQIMRECMTKGAGALKSAIRCYTGGAPSIYLKNIQTYMVDIRRELRVGQLDALVEVLRERETLAL